jgi:hypothetical protein
VSGWCASLPRGRRNDGNNRCAPTSTTKRVAARRMKDWGGRERERERESEIRLRLSDAMSFLRDHIDWKPP